MDNLISALIDLLWWPYETWKRTTESSRVGISPQEHDTIRFWRRVAWFGTIVIVVPLLVLWLLLG